ncbi:hypothetical protein Sjap_003038 [Stephania japonica]|uniref:Uncharacterized protein n=1 Tax=Stephania japonica TaxID=461633 RepID=A0AAP0PT47_9MAGN
MQGLRWPGQTIWAPGELKKSDNNMYGVSPTCPSITIYVNRTAKKASSLNFSLFLIFLS